MISPTQRTLAHCRKLGHVAAITEHWNHYARVRQDLFGFIDVLVIDPGCSGCIAIQTTSGSNTSKRQRKIEAIPAAVEWLRAGNQIIVVGWAKRGPRGKRKVWTGREVYAALRGDVIEWHETPMTATLKPGWKLPEANCCERTMRPVAYFDGREVSCFFECCTCGKCEPEIEWPFVDEYANALDFRRLGFGIE